MFVCRSEVRVLGYVRVFKWENECKRLSGALSNQLASALSDA